MKIRLQNKIARSEATLPICIAIAAMLWWLPRRSFFLPEVLGFGFCLLTAYIIMETNTRQHLFRIRTQLTICTWLIFSACLSFMHSWGEPIVAAALLSVAHMLLFRCYQQNRPEAFVFHTFLMLSIGSFAAPTMLLMAIPFFIYLASFLRALTWKSFWAGILGLVTPYWCFAVWCFMTESIGTLSLPLFKWQEGKFLINYDFSSPLWVQLDGRLSFPELFSAAFIILLGIVSSIHFLRTSFDDKIHARMILYIYVAQTFLLSAFLILQPSSYETTMALLVVNVCPLIAHYFSLSDSLWTTAFFLLTLLLTVTMSALNLWMTSFSIS